MANNYKVHSYSHLIVKDLDKAYFLPYLRSSCCKESRLYDDNKYMYFDYAKKDTKESDLMRPIRHLATIGDAIPSLSDHREPTQSVRVADCYFIVNVLDLPFASPLASSETQGQSVGLGERT